MAAELGSKAEKNDVSRKGIILRFGAILLGSIVAGLGPCYSVKALDASAQETKSVVSAEKPAEEVYKNIQVFKGIPAPQLMRAMSFIAASLKVDCTHCHIQNQFEKDDKQAKQTARRMIRMMFNINKANFDGKLAVNCYSCHRGQLRPATALTVARDLWQKPPPKPVAVSSSDSMPTVDQIFEDYVRAVGGKGAMEKVTSRVVRGFLETPGGMHAPIEMYQKAPNKLLSIIRLPGGTSLNCFNGAVGWSQNPQVGVREVSGEELARLKREAEFYRELKLKEIYTRINLVGKDKVGDREVYVLEGIAADGNSERLYFDARTALLLRHAVVYDSPLGSIPLETDFEDYKEVEGIRLPFTIRRSRPDFSFATKFDDIKHDVAIDDSKFHKPAKQ